jgi:hypothetical protein
VSKRPGWYVVDRETDMVLRGPYIYQEAAGAVRQEMEYFCPTAKWNLWVIWKGDENKD